MIKFKSPVRNAFVTTLGEKENGEHMYLMGDQTLQTSSKSTETTPAATSANAATQVQTIAELKPTEPASEEAKIEASKAPVIHELQASFVRDTIADGTVLAPGVPFRQVWTVRNPGPSAWPAGCSVRFTGGDGMFNVDSNRPSSSSDIVRATESNVVDRAVEVGEEIDFAILMKTPENEGRVISYWRLKVADGVSFGHKLWCDVTVRIPDPVSDLETTTKDAGEVPTTKPIEDVAVVGREEPKEETQSQMIFPELDKESPVSSTHEAQTTPAVLITDEAEWPDVESLDLAGDESDDFLSDEEYEFLNASDDERMEALNGRK